MESVTADRTPVTVECQACGHVWIVGYLPMPASRFARLLAQAACPMCGESTRILLAQPAPVTDGHTKEPV